MSEVREDAEKKAQRLGLTLVKPGTHEVFVDLDTTGELREFERRFLLAQKLWPTASCKFTKSVNGHDHAFVSIPELDPLKEHERIALQAALNSDPFREMLAICHGRSGYKHTSVFFEVPPHSHTQNANPSEETKP